MNAMGAKAPAAATDQRAKAEILPMDEAVRVTEDGPSAEISVGGITPTECFCGA